MNSKNKSSDSFKSRYQRYVKLRENLIKKYPNRVIAPVMNESQFRYNIKLESINERNRVLRGEIKHANSMQALLNKKTFFTNYSEKQLTAMNKVKKYFRISATRAQLKYDPKIKDIIDRKLKDLSNEMKYDPALSVYRDYNDVGKPIISQEGLDFIRQNVFGSQ